MTSEKHLKSVKPSRDDNETNPAIGQSRGIGSPEDAALIEGDNTVEGDVANDATPAGGVDPAQRGRTNK